MVTADQSDGIGAVRDARHVVAVLNTAKEVFNTPSLSSRSLFGGSLYSRNLSRLGRLGLLG